MSSSDRAGRAPARARIALLALAALMLPACTAAPLYGSSRTDLLGAAGDADLVDLRGRIAVAPADSRTGQIFRNALLFRLNGATTPTAPLYEIRATTVAAETVVSIQSGSGIPSASLYRVSAIYEVVRLADTMVILRGTRFGNAPFDRSEQLFASSRALFDAREQAAKEAAERVGFAVAAAIRKDARTPVGGSALPGPAIAAPRRADPA